MRSPNICLVKIKPEPCGEGGGRHRDQDGSDCLLSVPHHHLGTVSGKQAEDIGTRRLQQKLHEVMSIIVMMMEATSDD